MSEHPRNADCRRLTPWVVAVAALALLLPVASCHRQEGPIPARAEQIGRLIEWPGNLHEFDFSNARLSPDGRLVSYVDWTSSELHIRDLERQVTWQVSHVAKDGAEVSRSAVSNSGALVAFYADDKDEGVHILPVTASEPTAPQILLRGQWAEPLGWSPDDRHLLVVVFRTRTQADLGLLTVADGTWTVLKILDYGGSGGCCGTWFLSPDGRFVAYDAPSSGGRGQHDIVLVPTDGAVEKRVFTDRLRVVGWSADGHDLLLLSDRRGSTGLWALPVRAGERAGDPLLIQADFRGHPMNVNAKGELLYVHAPTGQPPKYPLVIADLVIQGRQPAPALRPVAADPYRVNAFPSWSPDGRWFSYITIGVLGRSISLRSTETGQVREIPIELGAVWTAAWSPDSRSLVFKAANATNQLGIFVIDVQTGDAKPVVVMSPSSGAYYLPHFAPDNKAVVYFKVERLEPGNFTTGRWSLAQRGIQDGREQVLTSLDSLMRLDENPYPAGLSPDARFVLAYTHRDANHSTLRVLDRSTGQTRDLLQFDHSPAFAHDGEFQWMPDGRTFIANVRVQGKPGSYVSDTDKWELWSVSVEGGPPQKLDLGTSHLNGSAVAVHPNGREIAFLSGPLLRSLLPIVGRTVERYELRVLERLR